MGINVGIVLVIKLWSDNLITVYYLVGFYEIIYYCLTFVVTELDFLYGKTHFNSHKSISKVLFP